MTPAPMDPTVFLSLCFIVAVLAIACSCLFDRE